MPYCGGGVLGLWCGGWYGLVRRATIDSAEPLLSVTWMVMVDGHPGQLVTLTGVELVVVVSPSRPESLAPPHVAPGYSVRHG